MNIKQILPFKTAVNNSAQWLFSLVRRGAAAANPYFASYAIALSLVPFFFLVIFGLYMSNRAEEMGVQMKRLETKARFLARVQKQRNHFFREFGASDNDFLANYIETETLLSEDIRLLRKIQRVKEYENYEPIYERLSFLTGEKNTMAFELVDSHSADFYREKSWKLLSPVEMNCTDIKKILALIEGVKIDNYLPNPLRPQLVITTFDLSLKPQDNNNKVFSVDMEILQRGCYGNPG